MGVSRPRSRSYGAWRTCVVTPNYEYGVSKAHDLLSSLASAMEPEEAVTPGLYSTYNPAAAISCPIAVVDHIRKGVN
jgi:hypothetical protein